MKAQNVESKDRNNQMYAACIDQSFGNAFSIQQVSDIVYVESPFNDKPACDKYNFCVNYIYKVLFSIRFTEGPERNVH